MMELKRKMRLAIELVLVTSALPLLLLGCGGGGSSSGGASTDGMMSGQFWTDLTGNGIKRFIPGALATASSVAYPAAGVTQTASFVPGGGRYSTTGIVETISGVAWVTRPQTAYYLASGGWTISPSTTSFTASNSATFSYSELASSIATTAVSAVDLSTTWVVANSAVPAVDTLGYASSVSPASTQYPAGSYSYVLTTVTTTSATEHWIYTEPFNEVTTVSGSPNPITAATFSDADFKLHSTTADPICVRGFALVYTGPGNQYDFYGMALNGGVPAGTYPDCQNATIVVAGGRLGTYDVTFSSILGTDVVTFSNPTVWFIANNLFSNLIIGVPMVAGVMPTQNKAYFGDIASVGTSTSTTYYLNKTAMDAALTAWGVPTF